LENPRRFRNQTAFSRSTQVRSAARRHSVGVEPVARRKARLNVLNEPAQVEGDHRDRGPRLHWVGQTALRGVDPVAVEEVREVPMTHPMVDEPTQAVFGRSKLARKPADGQPLAAPAVGVHEAGQRDEQQAVGGLGAGIAVGRLRRLDGKQRCTGVQE
jgi:hypothetical protein